MVPRVQAKRVRYIQLPDGWAEECLRSDTLRLDLSTDQFFKVCIHQNWDALTRAYRARGDPIHAAASRADQVRAFYQDDGDTLWITFHAGRMHWTFIDPRIEPWAAQHGAGSMRRTRPWRNATIFGDPLWTSSLPSKWQNIPNASASVIELQCGDEIIRRLNGAPATDTARVEQLLDQLRAAAIPLVACLSTEDFSHLVELIFTSSGWRRQSKSPDAGICEFELTSPRERALVRSMPIATQEDLDDFRASFGGSTYDRLIFVHHSGHVRGGEPRINVIEQQDLARATVEAGLLTWVLNRSR
jgi:hypothetical protein